MGPREHAFAIVRLAAATRAVKGRVSQLPPQEWRGWASREQRAAGARAPDGARPLSNLPQRGRGRRGRATRESPLQGRGALRSAPRPHPNPLPAGEGENLPAPALSQSPPERERLKVAGEGRRPRPHPWATTRVAPTWDGLLPTSRVVQRSPAGEGEDRPAVPALSPSQREGGLRWSLPEGGRFKVVSPRGGGEAQWDGRSEGVGVVVEPFADEVVEGAVILHGAYGFVELVLQVCVVLAEADADAGVERHVGADDD